ncbi:hypothetical protein R84B8_00924 [Treponema sp. R8-4-B8]
MKRIFLLSITILVFIIVSCSSEFSNSGDDSGVGVGGGYPTTGSGGKGADGGEAGSNGGNGTAGKPKPGQLTCGEWSDLKNYDFYLNLFTITDDDSVPEEQRRNGFANYIEYFGFETRYMVIVNVFSGESPAGDAIVDLYHSGQKLFSAKTNANGNAYLFPSYNVKGENITIKINAAGKESQQILTYNGEPVLIALNDNTEKSSLLDLMFVIDTTGSMGDEMLYLKSEISNVINSIAAANPDYNISLALLFYRDIGDEYVTRYFDFTDNIAQQRQNLARQSASGGGDFPEAMDRALTEAVGKNWNSGNATRLIFHVCDAPPHDNQQSQSVYSSAIKTAAQKGIRIIPIASSGIDRATEYLLRQEAIITGGTYIFLTDDSGIGGSHLQATVGEFTVEYLNACIVRIVNEYLTGIETEPVSYY